MDELIQTTPPVSTWSSPLDSIIQAVKCFKCSKLHEVDSENFFTIHGNICIGIKGGIIGNNFDNTGKLLKFDAICKTCLFTFLKEYGSTEK